MEKNWKRTCEACKVCKLEFFFSLNIQIYGFFVITVAITLTPSVAEKTGDEVILTSCRRDNWSDRSDGFANYNRKEKNVKTKKKYLQTNSSQFAMAVVVQTYDSSSPISGLDRS